MPPAKRLFRKLNLSLCILLAGIYRLGKKILLATSYPLQPVKLALLISRPQDIDLLIDIHEKACQRPDIIAVFWVTERVVNRFPAALKQLSDYQVKPEFTLKHAFLYQAAGRLCKIDGLLTTVESTLAAHKIPYLLTKIANAAGIETFTLQHGFENLGLTYMDGTYGPHIRFAAKTVLTWGPVQSLPPAITDETRRKCVAVGCPKLHLATPSGRRQTAGDRPIIAVFEGLHASRFDNQYIIRFFKDLQDMAQNFPKLRFILKPHPGALVRTLLHAKSLASLRGIEVLDPAAPESGYWTTPRLLTFALAAITTPSTIALDSALTGTPVAVIRYNQMIPYYAYYEPLPLIDKTADWQNFLNEVSRDPVSFEPLQKTFLDKVILSGDAAERILDIVVEYARQGKEKQKFLPRDHE